MIFPARLQLPALLMVCFFVAPPVSAQTSSADFVKVSAHLNYKALQPGQQAVIAVVMDIEPQYHSQSHVPAGEGNVATEVTIDPLPQITISPSLYPQGQDYSTPALGALNVYTGRTIIFVPVEVKRNAPAGDVTIGGSITCQICNDEMCYPPATMPFSISTKIVPAGTTLAENEPELFRNFDPTTFASSVAPTEKLFGFSLTRDAYWIAFPGALLVGLIFNIMPCVLPIVPLKIMGFYKASQENRAKSVALGAVFSAGLIATFGVLALAVVVLHKIAWGELFSNPWFSAAIVAVLVILALQTFGAFEVVLPSSIYNVTPKSETYLGNFLFGILTAILSTPCTFGMFLGLLVWATYQPPTIGMALVMTVGMGMALPYLILSAFPEVARQFPRAGPWAEIVKQMMGFLLLATALYFGRRFLPGALGDRAFWWLLFAVIAIAGGFLIARTIHFTRRPKTIAIAAIVALLLVAPALAVTLRLTYVPIHWVKYSPQALADARAAGKSAVVKFTATWCGNCQAIEATVYVDKRTVESVKQRDVVMLKADLTDKNALGWDLLRSLHPVGAIPFTAVYLPGDEDPHKLAGIYTTDDLLRTLSAGKS